jgi:hypothetical protein
MSMGDKKMKKPIFFLVLILSTNALAAPVANWINGLTIKNPRAGGVYSITPSGGTVSGCENNDIYVFTGPEKKTLLGMALTAYALDKKISAYVDGTCDPVSGRPSVSDVFIED